MFHFFFVNMHKCRSGKKVEEFRKGCYSDPYQPGDRYDFFDVTYSKNLYLLLSTCMLLIEVSNISNQLTGNVNQLAIFIYSFHQIPW